MAQFGWSNILAIVTLVILPLYCSFSTCYSTNPYLQQRRDKVGTLPGQSFNVSFAHYSGYITVNDNPGRTLFYWFIEARKDPLSKPLVLWLNGGPGCSSIAFGQTEEIGPFHVKEDGKTLRLNPYSWNKVANLLFVDAPAGVGFSYANKESDLLNSGDKRTAEDSLVFLLKWFERFPQYKKSEFYISGESYAGHYVPQLSQAIVRNNLINEGNTINLKGLLVGNPLIDDFHDQVGIFQFMWSTGMISDGTYNLLNLLCDFESAQHPSESCLKIMETANEEMGKIDSYSVFTPTCHVNVSQANLLLRRKNRVGRVNAATYDPCTEKHSIVFYNLPEVQSALHVDPDHKPAKWVTCSDPVFENWKDSPRTVLDVYRQLIYLGLRIWIFSGNTDAVIPVTSTRHSINALALPAVRLWRAWYDDGEVGGWTQEYAGLNFVIVRGAGHEVPLHRPKLALTLIKSFLAGDSMPKLENDLVSVSDS